MKKWLLVSCCVWKIVYVNYIRSTTSKPSLIPIPYFYSASVGSSVLVLHIAHTAYRSKAPNVCIYPSRYPHTVRLVRPFESWYRIIYLFLRVWNCCNLQVSYCTSIPVPTGVLGTILPSGESGSPMSINLRSITGDSGLLDFKLWHISTPHFHSTRLQKIRLCFWARTARP